MIEHHKIYIIATIIINTTDGGDNIVRTKGTYEYTENQEKELLNFITADPQTTEKIKDKMRTIYSSIHAHTVKRMLENLKMRGLIKGSQIGRVRIWRL